MRIKDTFLVIFGILSAIFICYNDYKISQELKELNQIQAEHLIPAPKEKVESVINQYYIEHPIIIKESVKAAPVVKNTPKIQKKEIKARIINIKDQKVIDEIAIYIKKKEGFSSHAYKDHKQYSIGYGTKAKSKTEVITQKEANVRLYKHIKKVILPSLNGVKFQSIEQVHAAIDFSYNVGHNRFKRDVVTKDGVIDCSKMMAYNKIRDKNGNLVYNEGLAQRRLENFLSCSSYEIIQ